MILHIHADDTKGRAGRDLCERRPNTYGIVQSCSFSHAKRPESCYIAPELQITLRGKPFPSPPPWCCLSAERVVYVLCFPYFSVKTLNTVKRPSSVASKGGENIPLAATLDIIAVSSERRVCISVT